MAEREIAKNTSTTTSSSSTAVLTNGRITSLFMKNIGGDTDSLSVGKTTDMEYLLISSILEEIAANQAKDIYIYSEVAHMMYSLILSIIKTMAIIGPLFPR